MAKTASSRQIAFENYERTDIIQGSSERSFGIVFAVFFVVVATLKYWQYWPNFLVAYPWLIASVATLAVTFICPKVLKPFNKLWMRFGLLLHRIVNPIVMGLLFFCILTPMGLLARAFKWDPLRLKLAPQEKTYWIVRKASQTTDLKNQF